MPTNDNYNYIISKIENFKSNYASLRNKSNEYVFSLLCIKSAFYKNPSLNLEESQFSEIVVDGVNDGGVDAMLTDPNSEASNFVLCQSKLYQAITFDDVKNAVLKLVTFYKDMCAGHYEDVNQKVQRRFISLNSEVGEESKVVFTFFTSAQKNGIRKDRIERAIEDLLNNSSKYELNLYFADDIIEDIKEAESRRPNVENGKILIDNSNNYLEYDDNAIIVNASAFSIKELYAEHTLTLLARNLRYHVAGRDIDKAINDSINNDPTSFWYKNNGMTIVCDDYDLDGRELKLKNFSIVNGGQTTFILHKSHEINRDNDLYVPCKIIKAIGDTEDDKNMFSLEIAKATNSQKAIKQVDLKANAPEQVRFAQAMRDHGIFYQTKRGEIVPPDFRTDYKNTDLSEVGKLCLSAIFQIPATSRSKPSSMYNLEFYNPIFNSNQEQIVSLVKQFLYIDYYFRKRFLKIFDDACANNPNGSELITFAHNARTLCISFTVLASRFVSGNISQEDLQSIFHNNTDNNHYDIFKNINNYFEVLPENVFENKDKCDEILYKLFSMIIKSGRKSFAQAKRYDQALNETNYLKKDANYYSILSDDWDNLSVKIQETFDSIEENE